MSRLQVSGSRIGAVERDWTGIFIGLGLGLVTSFLAVMLANLAVHAMTKKKR
jgi:hypothetical protein